MDLRDTVDLRAKEREWRAERVIWSVFVVVLLLAAAGLFGGGPLSRAEVVSQDDGATYTLRYEDLNRRDHVTVMLIETHAPGTEGEELQVALSRELVRAITVRSSVPGADGGSLGAEGSTYSFKVEDWDAPLVVSFEYLPEELGATDGVVTVKAGAREAVQMPFRHFVFP